jgi:hypothetical protein
MGYDILTDYLASKYGLGCYQLMYEFNPRIMIFQKDENDCLDNYILSAGFDPYKCISYFCPNEMFEIKDLNLPYTRCYAMNSILRYKLGKHTPVLYGGAETTVDVERGMNYNLSTIKKCLEYLHRYDFCNLKKTIEYDMQQDQEIVNRMANMKPGVYQVFIDKDGYKHNFSSLTHTPNVRMDYKFYRCQNALIKETEDKYKREHPELFKEDPNVRHMTGEELLALAEQQKKEREELARKVEQEKIAKARYNFLHGKKYGAINYE